MKHAFHALSLLFVCSAAFAACSGDDPTIASSTTGPVLTGAGGSGSSSGSTMSSTSSGMGANSGTGGQSSGSSSSGNGGNTGSGGSGSVTAAKCFEDDYVMPLSTGPNYDQFNPVIGSHCMGTNHQDIQGIERVVFLGDSITVGTPPTLSGDFYRAKVADALATKFGIDKPNLLWKSADPINGTAILKESGAFASCSKWGARTDDFLAGGDQIAKCFPADQLNKRTLVIMTMGGNDVASITKDATNGATQMDLMNKTQGFVNLMREAIAWFYEPGRFPKGINVVFANNYEFTDGTAEVQSCDVSGLAGFDQPVPSPQELSALIIWANEQYMSIAVEFNADMIFLLEDFCGHGFNADNPAAPCYRGPGNQNWFDLTCIHPNPTGHQHITDMFMAVVNE